MKFIIYKIFKKIKKIKWNLINNKKLKIKLQKN